MRYPAILAAAVLLGSGLTAQADTIRTAGGIGVNGAITDMDAEGLVVQVETAKRSIPLADVARIECEKFPDLTTAEGALFRARNGSAKPAADFERAERLYQSLAAKEAAPPWLKLLSQWRLCQVYAESGRVAQALDAYLALAKAQPKLATRIKLPKPNQGDKANADMAAKVEAALKTAGTQAYAAELKTFREALTLSTGGAAEGSVEAIREMRQSANPKDRDWAAAKEIEMDFGEGKVDEAEKVYDEMAKEWAERSPADAYYWKGRLLQEKKTYMSAALEYMRVAILAPTADKNRTADALCRAGKAMELAKAPAAETTKVYQEAVTKYPGTPGADQAKKELARLSAAAPAPKK